MSDLGPSYEDGHLFVAAIRVLEHKLGRPPSVEETGELLGRSAEISHSITRGLEKRDIVRVVTSPFENHVEIINHAALEELSRGEQAADFGDDLEEFRRKKQQEHDEFADFFNSGGLDKKKQAELEKLESEFNKFRGKDRSPEGDEE